MECSEDSCRLQREIVDHEFRYAVVTRKYAETFRQELQVLLKEFEVTLLCKMTAQENQLLKELSDSQACFVGNAERRKSYLFKDVSCASQQIVLQPETLHEAPAPSTILMGDLDALVIEMADGQRHSKTVFGEELVKDELRVSFSGEEFHPSPSDVLGSYAQISSHNRVSSSQTPRDTYRTVEVAAEDRLNTRATRVSNVQFHENEAEWHSAAESVGMAQSPRRSSGMDGLRCPSSLRMRESGTVCLENSDELSLANRKLTRRNTKDCQLLGFWRSELSQSARTLNSKGSDLSHFQNRMPSSRTRSHKTSFADQIQNPTSISRIIWDSVASVLLAFDWFYIPLVLLNPGWTGFTTTTWVISIVYWGLDVPSSFFAGYQQEGTLEKRVSKTVQRYLRTWFLPDVLLISLDLTLFKLHLDDNYARSNPTPGQSFRALRGLRVIRIMRLVRILKMRGFFNQAFELVTSEYIRTVLYITRNLVLVLAVNHVFACFWYFIGAPVQGESYQDAVQNYGWVIKIMSRPGRHQTIFEGIEGTIDLAQVDIPYFYFTALHWSLTQFTPASMEVVPTTVIERIYTVVVLVFAMVAFSTFISSITQAMTTMRIIADEKESRNQALRRYFRDQGVSPAIQMRIWRQVDAQQKRVRTKQVWVDIKCLTELPDILRIELQHDVYGRRLVAHPLFFYFQEMSANAFRSICHRGVEEFHCRTDDLLFGYATDASKMYFLVWGMLKYHKLDEEKRHEVVMGTVTKNDWCSENALWIKWQHAGSMAANVDSIVMTLDALEFMDTVRRYPDTHPPLKVYAEAFAAYVNDNLFQGITDLSLHVDEVHDMVFSSLKEHDDDLPCGQLSSDFRKMSKKASKGSIPRNSHEEKSLLGRITSMFQARRSGV